MRQATSLTLLLVLAPAAALAQGSGAAQSSTSATARTPSVTASANTAAAARFHAPKGWTADGSAKLEAMYASAQREDLPREPIAKRVHEGYAKGASESTILASAGKVKANLEASHEAMVAAGRKPSDQETERGATAMEHGVTRAQIETMARRAPSDRSLVVAFDVLGKLAARGVPVTHAMTQVQAKLDARASDASLISLVAKGGSQMSMAVPPAGSPASTVGVTAAGTATGATKGVTAGVAGAVTGVVKRP